MFPLRKINEPVSYLQKPVQKMNTIDYMELVEKFTKQFSDGTIQNVNSNAIAPVVCGGLPADIFTLSGKLNRQTRKQINSAVRAGELPKKPTIQDFYDKIVAMAKENFADRL